MVAFSAQSNRSVSRAPVLRNIRPYVCVLTFGQCEHKPLPLAHDLDAQPRIVSCATRSRANMLPDLARTIAPRVMCCLSCSGSGSGWMCPLLVPDAAMQQPKEMSSLLL